MESIIQNYQKKEVFLVGALDSLGVPYTPDNENHQSFVELTALAFKEKGISLTYYNLCSLGRNKTYELERILRRNYTMEEYRRFNHYACEYVFTGKKEGEFPFPVSSTFLQDFFAQEQPNLEITSSLKESEAPIFLYTCGGMNIRDALKIKSRPKKEDLPKVAHEVFCHAKEHIRRTKAEVEHSIAYIQSFNPNMEIYVLGVYAMLEQAPLRKLAYPFVKWYNYELKDVIKKFSNVHYVDIQRVKNMVAPHDMHPSFEGQKYISKQLIKKMDEVCQNRHLS